MRTLLIERVDQGVAGTIARLANRIPIIENVRRFQARVSRRVDRDLQPLVLDRAVGPNELDPRRAGNPRAEPHADRSRSGPRCPGRRIVAIADAKREIRGRQVGAGQAGDINDEAVDPLVVTRVVSERSRGAGQQSLLVGGNRAIVGSVGGGILAIERRMVVEQIASNHGHRNQVAISGFGRAGHRHHPPVFQHIERQPGKTCKTGTAVRSARGAAWARAAHITASGETRVPQREVP